jgi:hypothetical protein
MLPIRDMFYILLYYIIYFIIYIIYHILNMYLYIMYLTKDMYISKPIDQYVTCNFYLASILNNVYL